MAGVGPPPKPNAIRRNEIDLSHLVQSDVPERLKKLRNRTTYPAAVQHWWDVWASSPQAEVFHATDWERLQMLAPLVDAYYRRPGHNALAEIRQNESLLGATVTDRMRLRMTPKQDPKSPDELPPDVADFMSFRKSS
jgi:hypothetical protein